MIAQEDLIAGIDEVGKGSLFGPVFAAAVVLNKSSEVELLQAGLKDSKKLTKKKILQLTPLIKKASTAWALGQASSREIDYAGIREATEKAMIRALQRLPHRPTLILVDGNLPLRPWKGKQKTIVQGENHFPAIAAASVIAKEARDSLIIRLSQNFPNYGLEKNVGYGTKLHIDSLKTFGATKLHRQSFLSKIIC